MKDGEYGILIFIISFWVFLGILGNVFSSVLDDEALAKNKPSDYYTFTERLQGFPIIGDFVTIFKVMSFQYSDLIHPYLSAFLIMLNALTVYISFNMIRGR